MLRFDKAILFSPLFKSNVLVNVSIKTCGLEVSLFFWVHKCGIHFYNWFDLIMLLYTFLVIFFDWYKE